MPPRCLLCLLLAARASSLAITAEATRASPKAPTAEATRSPLTLLGGFLGAGKTTALTHLLTNRDGLRIAVLVNDVAAVNVDAMSLRRTVVEEDGNVAMVQLENGCVCCSASGDLAPAVAELIEKNARRGEPPFDHVVIELSGVADPANVVDSLEQGGFVVDRKVAVVDAQVFPDICTPPGPHIVRVVLRSDGAFGRLHARLQTAQRRLRRSVTT
jgi:Ni2+-binding GTPase involved in maturation of urease and hydrogenase